MVGAFSCPDEKNSPSINVEAVCRSIYAGIVLELRFYWGSRIIDRLKGSTIIEITVRAIKVMILLTLFECQINGGKQGNYAQQYSEYSNSVTL
jgi:hypothetical protein